MTMRIALAALAALVLATSTPASAAFKFGRPDRWQCAYGYDAGGRSVWHYGDTVQWKPDARSTALRSCRAKSPSCQFLGCFRRL
jgi:hypothetical protein